MQTYTNYTRAFQISILGPSPTLSLDSGAASSSAARAFKSPGERALTFVDQPKENI
jgi:hypothetical protein